MFAATPGRKPAGRDAYSLFRTPGGPPGGPPRLSAATSSSMAAPAPAARRPPSAGAGASASAAAAMGAPRDGGARTGADGGDVVASMIAELYAYASDPAGYHYNYNSSSSSSSSCGTSTPTTTTAAAATTCSTASTAGGRTCIGGGRGKENVYEAYASRSPSEQRSRLTQRLTRSHTSLMGRLDQLAAATSSSSSSTMSANGKSGKGGGGVGTASFQDGRFLLWVAATLLNPDGTVVRRCLRASTSTSTFTCADGGDGGDDSSNNNMNNNGDGVALAEELSRRLVETLDGLAGSVRACLCGNTCDEDAVVDRDMPMLRVLLERNANGGSFLLQDREEEEEEEENGGGGGDDGGQHVRSYLALPSKIQEALNGPSSAGRTGTGTDAGTGTKRRKLHNRRLHGGGYVATGTCSTANFFDSTAGATATASAPAPASAASSTAVLSYVLASYLSSESCPFSSSNEQRLSWDLLRACTVHAAAEMGLVCHLPSVRAGLVCYGLDRLTMSVAAADVGAAVDEDEDEDGGYDAAQEEEGANIISGDRIDGLSPVTLVELILSDGG